MRLHSKVHSYKISFWCNHVFSLTKAIRSPLNLMSEVAQEVVGAQKKMYGLASGALTILCEKNAFGLFNLLLNETKYCFRLRFIL